MSVGRRRSVRRAGVYRRHRYIIGTHGRRGESCRRIHSPLFARYDGVACPSVGGGPSVGPGYIVGVDTPLVPTVVGANHAGEFIRRYSPDADAAVRRSAAVRPSAAVRRAGVYRRCRYIVGTHGRRGESCRRIHSPLFARYDGVACPSVGGGSSVGGGPSVGPAYIVGIDTSLVPTVVGANHAGEFIRRYSPDMTGWRVRRSGRSISSASIHRWYPRS